MIVRILGAGQFEVPDTAAPQIDELDEEFDRAVETGDVAAFQRVVPNLIDLVKESGTPLPPGHFGPSDLILPSADSSLDEVRRILEG